MTTSEMLPDEDPQTHLHNVPEPATEVDDEPADDEAPERDEG